MASLNSLNARKTLQVGDKSYEIFSLDAVEGLKQLPYALRILGENLLRNEDGANITADQIKALAAWNPDAQPSTEIQFTPARVVMQDFTGVPCVVDLATMREAVKELGGDPKKINPLAPAEMVIDHSVQIDYFGRVDALKLNTDKEYERNSERYKFLRWGQGAFNNFRVVPPGTGIIHQVNIEYLARSVFTKELPDGTVQAYPDTCVGTDSHTTMVNGLGVLGWGVGGIEAEAAMLGQPVSMLIPRVVGFKLSGSIPASATATDVVLTITQMLREHGVVGKFVEFYGEGVTQVPLANRATIGNMSPEFGSTAAIFPIDQVTVDYLRLTGRDEERCALVEAYAMEQGLWHDPSFEPKYSEYLELDLSTVVPSIAGPKRPQDRIKLSDAKRTFEQTLVPTYAPEAHKRVELTTADGTKTDLDHGRVVIASVTSCTNTSNPSVMMAAGLLARNARTKGLKSKPWVKTSVAPGSQVVTDYFDQSGLWKPLDELGFNLVGYGCATCIGNSGPLSPEISKVINDNDLAVTAVLSGNRNFEGRISPDVKMNYLASPPLVVAYALAGTMDFDFETEPLGQDQHGNDVFLRDIWPDPTEVQRTIDETINRDMYTKDYANVFAGDERWQSLPTPEGSRFTWDDASTYVRKAPFFDGMKMEPEPVRDIHGARVLLKLGDSVTTDHISPAGAFKPETPAGQYLTSNGVQPKDFNSYGSRRGNHEVMMRGTFANIRIKNQLLDGVEGGFTRDFTKDGGPQAYVYDASMHYQAEGIPLVVLGGKEYGTGSSRDWAAKGTRLLGVKAVIAQSFERIHRSNLIGMGILPLQFPEGESADSLGLDGTETFDISGVTVLNEGKTPETVKVCATKADGSKVQFDAVVRIDTPGEADYYRNDGILRYVLRNLVKA
ncbi:MULTISPECIES: aconitate hydratase AcnA [Mobiluncus]|nr:MULTISPECIES: aconitate hydratase AcnA [Mobiluncus]MCU9987341.1 aconitate hydratase AcnA [Mobiluncus curtisii]MCV0000591.1 aconitate hydratase AcnA [Mobiluncus curtisii]NMW49643.1 aconitate hydratase AcnA [Mobiluncus curtisii]NMW87667.1 aconitate hydratase AcnA [Mobiluncus curtisii]NMX14330.1 aconitate hydratase AcnA [Mobiluncus curtisii]